jgi:hypothetical protein
MLIIYLNKKIFNLLIMDTIYEYKYNQFRYILSGCRTIIDAYNFGELYLSKNPEMKLIIYSMINGKKYDNIIDFTTIKYIINELTNQQYYEDALKILEQYKTTDSTQNIILQNIISQKPKKQNIIKYITNIKQIIIKKCPHCNIDNTGDTETTYYICGYNDTKKGYNWNGCGKDWCFSCGKFLCKSWNINQLHVESNRYHNIKCCLNHCIAYNKNHPNNIRNYNDDYCQCGLNENVKRK